MTKGSVNYLYIETAFDLFESADRHGRLAVMIPNFEWLLELEPGQLSKMPHNERISIMYSAAFAKFHEMEFFLRNKTLKQLASVTVEGKNASRSVDLAPAMGLPGIVARDELATLRAFMRQWTGIYEKHATQRHGRVVAWCSGPKFGIEWNVPLQHETTDKEALKTVAEEITRKLSDTVESSKTLTAWLKNVRHGLRAMGPHSWYAWQPEIILGIEKTRKLPIDYPSGEAKASQKTCRPKP